MKKYTLPLLLLLFVAFHLEAAVVSVSINGKTQFCPGENRESSYTIAINNFTSVSEFVISCNRCMMKDPYDNTWKSSVTASMRPNFSSILVKWDNGNFADASINFWVRGSWTWIQAIRSDQKSVKLVDNNRYATNGENTLSGAGTINCGSTTPLTYTANWINASSYVWSASGGTYPSTTSKDLTFTPYPDQSIIINKGITKLAMFILMKPLNGFLDQLS